MKKTLFALALAAGITSFAGTAKAGVNLVNNGSFTNGFAGWVAVNPYQYGEDTMNVYTYYHDQNYAFHNLAPYGKVAGLVADSTYPGEGPKVDSLSQQIATIKGDSYHLIFNFATFNGVTYQGTYINNGDSSLSVSIGTQTLFSVQNQDSSPTGDLITEDIVFTSLADNEILTISGYNPTIPNVIGDVAVVPEPSQVAASLLLVTGIAGFVIVRRKNSTALAA